MKNKIENDETNLIEIFTNMWVNKLKIAKIKGIDSSGMLCSESELNLSNESAGIIELKNKNNEISFKPNKELTV